MPEKLEYRGYEIVLQRQWSQWCASIFPVREDLPLIPRSTLRTLASSKTDALAEAKESIDRMLASE
jgi:hypothetical protein